MEGILYQVGLRFFQTTRPTHLIHQHLPVTVAGLFMRAALQEVPAFRHLQCAFNELANPVCGLGLKAICSLAAQKFHPIALAVVGLIQHSTHVLGPCKFT